MLGFFIAMISGALMSVQGVFNTDVGFRRIRADNGVSYVYGDVVRFGKTKFCRTLAGGT